jgi:flagellar protein FliO/FliZ
MSLQYLPVVFFLLALASVPFLLRWLKSRVPQSGVLSGAQNKLISVIAVGPHQRVVTVEVGPAHERVWLTLGVSSAGIQCLHTSPAVSPEIRELSA